MAALSWQGAASAAATSVAIPTHAVGDIIVLFAFRNGSSAGVSAPAAGGTVPTWISLQSPSTTGISGQGSYFVATATNHTTGTWTNATLVAVGVVRGQHPSSPIGGNNNNATGTATADCPGAAITLADSSGASFILALIGAGTPQVAFNTAPSGWTRRTTTNPTPGSAPGICINTKDTTTSGAAVTQSNGGSATGDATMVVEIKVAPFVPKPHNFQLSTAVARAAFR